MTPITVPERFRDLPSVDGPRPCDVCGLAAQFHYDGWDGNYLGCEEAGARRGFHRVLVDPATGPRLDAMLKDCARIDAEQLAADQAAHEYAQQLEDEDAFAGQACGPNCGFCGRCS